MTPGSHRTRPLRAITAVIALYAFVLQGFLGGLMPTPMAGDVHALCLSGAAAAGDPSPDTPHVHADCCTAAHHVADALAPRDTAATIIWPQGRVATTAFWRAAANAPRAPPRAIAHPRGPPVA
ncbi:hypothetical protein MKK55_03620 [Methylobacterium sp. J-059]|uniref:hypothetical protein n=1 Tax=Methylobacterium sp. J-059 TaxID=2836643 RepID=UPI001FB8EC1A|nr:hypothetical protein [Methylobacterium sp. J-059]MCJ2038047.1 hypothetical protein [Methylobacterium sp. J-059]